ncbi:MAG: PEP-CTERM sorting domain-containing protein [Pseudomonadota bacterium]
MLRDGGDALFAIDLDDRSITMSNISGFNVANGDLALTVTLGNLVWSNDPAATITGIENFVATGITGGEPGDVTTQTNGVVIDYRVTVWSVGASLSFDLTTSHGGAIPEPGSLALFLVALGGLGFMMRRRVA